MSSDAAPAVSPEFRDVRVRPQDRKPAPRTSAFGRRPWTASRSRSRAWRRSRSPTHMTAGGRPPRLVRPGARYRFRLPDGGLCVPDPASRAQPDDAHGPSLVVDPRRLSLALPKTGAAGPGKRRCLYELHPGLLGGFPGVADALPALADLGITAVELMPIAEFSGNRNWGYDGVLPYRAGRALMARREELKALDRPRPCARPDGLPGCRL